ncbi:protein FAR1-RELATED SEQUENCE 5-like [Apium graveolens]|uniref:protein FAR1-RELATED SEQUENCE 5-like n=1 Tax=Apium graveolens TaxID=4045 RepID=UPI003D78DE5A
MNKSFNTLVVEHGGHENMPFNKKDYENYMRIVRRLRLEEGDVVALQYYFNKAQLVDSNFYYSIDLDDENKIKNLFWADARCRAAYKEFRDVMTFDTTYLTNKYDMLFAPFVGVNHHGQSILLGCGLISNEDTPTFTCTPSLVFMAYYEKIPENLKGYKEYESIKFHLQRIVYDSIDIDTFEFGWNAMISKYNLENNDWLRGLYDGRRRWISCFVKDCFWAGISTTQRSESMNAFFDGYVNGKTSLREFVGKSDCALKDKVEKEVEADTRSLSTFIPCVTQHHMEKQFQDIYTNDKFKEFQKEIINVMYCECSLLESVGSIFQYQVEGIQYIGDCQTRRTINYNVCFVKYVREDYEVKCGCRLFEFRGIICRHIIKVLLFKQNIFTISSKYILRRLRKNIKRSHSKTKVTYSTWRDTEEKHMYDLVCDAFYRIVDLSTEKTERCNHLVGIFKKLELEWENDDEGSSKIISTNIELDMSKGKKVSNWSVTIHSPIKKRSKGRPPTKRKQSKVDTVVKNLQKKSKKRGKKNILEPNLINLNVPSEEALIHISNEGSSRDI